MNLKNKKIGIWGFGIVGKSLLQFLAKHTSLISVMDNRQLHEEEKKLLLHHQATYYEQSQGIEPFLDNHELLCVSAGIDIRSYPQYHYKLLPELDLFYYFFKKPIIAITGTIGKTSTTTLISMLLKQNNIRIAIVGNIGVGIMDLIDIQDQFDCAVLEISSFQLEYSKIFAPDIAILTNFFANHLDRHTTIQDYFNAKARITQHQTTDQYILAPVEIINSLETNAQKITFSVTKKEIDLLHFYIKNQHIILTHKYDTHIISPLPIIPGIFVDNILVACTTLYIWDTHKKWNINLPGVSIMHRMEYLGYHHGAYFYNDSKATVPQATLAALNNLQGKSIILFLGGLSKGIDRSIFINQLPHTIKYILCFGKEAEYLHSCALKRNLPSNTFETLEQAFNHCLTLLKPNDYVLFSPAGSSFDLFKDYQGRGNAFKQLVQLIN